MRTDIEYVISLLEEDFNTDECVEVVYTKSSVGVKEVLELVFYFDEGKITMQLWDSEYIPEDDGEDLYHVIKDRFKTVVKRFNRINDHIK